MKTPICQAPFKQMTLKPDGKVALCCYQYHVEMGDCARNSLAEIWNNHRYQKIRNEFLQGIPNRCKKKIESLQCHKLYEHLADRGEIVSRTPKKLDLRLNSKCQLRCVMCDVWQGPNDFYNDLNFWNEFTDKIAPYLKEVELLGGEPFIQAETFKVIEVVMQKNPGCVFSFVTNGNFIVTKKIRDLFVNLPLRKVLVSMDSLNSETYAKIRRDGNFHLMRETFDFFLSLNEARKGTPHAFMLSASLCVLKANWSEIPDFLRFCRENSVVPELQYAHYDPSRESSVKYYSEKEKLEMQAHLSALTLHEDRQYLRILLNPSPL